MTLEDAQKLCPIIAMIDGGCGNCIDGVIADLHRAFPQFEWSFDDESAKPMRETVTVREKDNA